MATSIINVKGKRTIKSVGLDQYNGYIRMKVQLSDQTVLLHDLVLGNTSVNRKKFWKLQDRIFDAPKLDLRFWLGRKAKTSKTGWNAFEKLVA